MQTHRVFGEYAYGQHGHQKHRDASCGSDFCFKVSASHFSGPEPKLSGVKRCPLYFRVAEFSRCQHGFQMLSFQARLGSVLPDVVNV
jgi:hypothetical protein